MKYREEITPNVGSVAAESRESRNWIVNKGGK